MRTRYCDAVSTSDHAQQRATRIRIKVVCRHTAVRHAACMHDTSIYIHTAEQQDTRHGTGTLPAHVQS